ncbi:MAG: PhoH family protein [Clostridiales bacterium]|nr:PhoH family protein [Clostridiales bacterium]
MANIFGNNDSNISIVEEAFNVKTEISDNNILIRGEEENACSCAAAVLEKMAELSAKNELITRQMTAYFCDMAAEGGIRTLQNDYMADVVCINAKGKPVRPKTNGQAQYIEAMQKHPLVFGIGPAGTGKTYLAVAMAVSALKKNEISRIILTRPAVEAGEKLGFLPGDLQSKVDPYVRPLYDALYDIMGFDGFTRNFERGTIEIAPLAYMRGRTLDNSFIILDEAQNTTQEQLKMFLTRIGQGSKAVVTGDVTQIDLPPDKSSGLKKAKKILGGVPEIAFLDLTEKDVVRCELVQKVIKAYERYERKGEN